VQEQQPVQELTSPVQEQEEEQESEWQVPRSMAPMRPTMMAPTWWTEPDCEEQTPSQVATLSQSAVRQEEAA
jgi:hypothetical protein